MDNNLNKEKQEIAIIEVIKDVINSKNYFAKENRNNEEKLKIINLLTSNYIRKYITNNLFGG